MQATEQTIIRADGHVVSWAGRALMVENDRLDADEAIEGIPFEVCDAELPTLAEYREIIGAAA